MAAEWQRFYLGYQGRFSDDVLLTLPSCIISVSQSPSANSQARGLAKGQVKESKVKDPSLTGTTVWDGSICLAMTLCNETLLMTHAHETSSMLELGAGCALVSLAVAAERLVSRCCITDLAEMVPSIEGQVRKNATVLFDARRKGRAAQIKVRALKWGPEGEEDIARIEEEELARGAIDQPCSKEEEEEEGGDGQPTTSHFDIIVGSDLIYYSYCKETPHTQLLLWTLKRLSGPQTLIFLALSLHHNPEEVQSFLALALEEGFVVDHLKEEVPEDYRVEDVLVVRMSLRR
jgi:hypothetical protein